MSNQNVDWDCMNDPDRELSFSDNLPLRLEATRETVFKEATRVLHEGRKPKLLDIRHLFKKPTCAALQVYFDEWKKENKHLLKDRSNSEILLMIESDKQAARIKELEDICNHLEIDLKLSEQKHLNSYSKRQEDLQATHQLEVNYLNQTIKRLKEQLEQNNALVQLNDDGKLTVIAEQNTEIDKLKERLFIALEERDRAIMHNYSGIFHAKPDTIDSVIRVINEDDNFGICYNGASVEWYFGSINSDRVFATESEALIDFIQYAKRQMIEMSTVISAANDNGLLDSIKG